MTDNPSVSINSLVEQRNRCLQLLKQYGNDHLLQLVLGEATLAIADRSYLEPEREALSLGWRWIEEAHRGGVRDPRLWAAILRWGHDVPALVLEAEEQALRNPQLQGLALLLRLKGRLGHGDEDDLQALRALSSDDPMVIAHQALILARQGRRQEAMEVRWRLMRLKPFSAGVWRILLQAYDEQERALLEKDPDSPYALQGPTDKDWLLGPSELRLGWARGAHLALIAALFTGVALDARLLVAARGKGWNPEIPSEWEIAAYVRKDGSRIPWALGYPPWIATYEDQEAADFEAFTMSPVGFQLSLRSDGSAEINALAPPAHSFQASDGYQRFEAASPGGDGPFLTQWTATQWGIRVKAPNGYDYFNLVPRKDGILAVFTGRSMSLLLKRKGEAGTPLLWTDWRTQPQLIESRYERYLRARDGTVVWLRQANPGTVAFGYNRQRLPGLNGDYETPDGEWIRQDAVKFEWLDAKEARPPSTGLIFP